MNDEQDKKHGRLLAVIVFGIFAYFFGLHYANADMVAEDSVGTKMTLGEKPCANGKILAFAEFSGAPTELLVEGVAHIDGKPVEGCWAVNGVGMVVMFAENGLVLKWPMAKFKKAYGV